MRIDTESIIGRDGTQYITIEAIAPTVNERDLYDGGKLYSFEIDHIKQTTRLYELYFRNGCPRCDGQLIKKWKDEVLTAGECLSYCERSF